MITEAQKRMIILIINTIFCALLYFVVNHVASPYVMTLLYTVGGGALGIWYVVYNRGFRGYRKTPDMLPDSLTPAEKEEWIADGSRRFEKSRWALLILLPLLFTLMFDMIYLFLIPDGWFA